MGLEDHDADARPATLEEETRTVIENAYHRIAKSHSFVKLWPKWTLGYRTKRMPDRLFNV